MNGVIQVAVVTIVVLLCALYSTWRLLSARLRLRIVETLAGLPGIGSATWFLSWRARLLSGSGAGCSACAPSATSAASRKQTPDGLRRS
jgi:hypothetical protein